MSKYIPINVVDFESKLFPAPAISLEVGYHVTLKSNVKSIRQKGILPHAPKLPYGLGVDNIGVYFFAEEKSIPIALNSWLRSKLGPNPLVTILFNLSSYATVSTTSKLSYHNYVPVAIHPADILKVKDIPCESYQVNFLKNESLDQEPTPFS